MGLHLWMKKTVSRFSVVRSQLATKRKMGNRRTADNNSLRGVHGYRALRHSWRRSRGMFC
uniref:Uncharacterized protein n=1 Tax=Anguilla anguilla TaxID=7936 RepID=A0A0E9X0Y9_ANGAN